ncbi:efflux RND transporter periplasmic adaptor subunit [Clostridium sp. FP1]|uniref:efflux RND transporter periplasmic adaptor subunit n=1 Tax=Clostridium sp. FP1 TaxID=2724076 RepID=UPI0013E97135|nr:efflux RND transporter periplasmic adaptor subunit [Clostridium sp. FP1]MBZ9634799.1 efflux RND transporter periplasmic adaptor subunit [Clostridium sp. FP1]
MKKEMKSIKAKKKSWKMSAIITCVATLVGIGGYFGYLAITKTAVKTTQYMKLKATKGNIEVVVTASGTAGSSVSKDIVAQNNGTLGSFSVKPGDLVKSGQSIGTLVEQNADQSVQKAKNALDQDNLKLTQLKKSLNSLYVKAPVSGIVQTVNIAAGDDPSVIGKALGHAMVITYTGSDGKAIQIGIDSSSGSSSTVSKVYVTAGATVKKGDTLFTLNAEEINNSISSQNLNIQQDQTTLSNAQTQAGYNNFTAPVGGTVAALNFNPGDTIQSGKAVATIIDLTQMQTVVAVDELDIDKVKVGQKATITVDAITGKAFTGKVIKISSIGVSTNSVTTYDVTVSIDAADGVKTGMTTNVKVSVQTKENVVMLPIEAVQGTGNNKSITAETSGSSTSTSSNNSGNSSNGNVAANGSQRSGNGGGAISIASSGVTRKKIEVGISNQNYVEITSGVSEGDTALVAIIKSPATSTTKTTNPLSGSGGFGGAGGGYGGGGGRTGGGKAGN